MSCVVLEAPAGWGVGEPVDAALFEGLSDEAVLVELEKVERFSAWLAARGLSLTQRLLASRVESAWDRLAEAGEEASSGEAGRVLSEVYASVEDEVALATGVSGRVAQVRVGMVWREAERAEPIREALARGEVSWARAMQVFARTAVVPVEQVAGVVGKCVAPFPARSVHGKGGLLVPQQAFTSRLAREVARCVSVGEQNAAGVAGRGAWVSVDAVQGVGTVSVSGHVARVVGAHERVDEIARRLRREGDGRTLAQLRSDVALDLVLFGQLPGMGCADGVEGAAGTGQGVLDVAPYASFGGRLPVARVDVAVSLSSLVGASEEPGVVECAGRQEWLCARVVREIALSAGSTWRRLVTDPVTGYMGDLSREGYAVTGYLRERVFARDRVSRAVGRERPARWCDTDHEVDWAAGGASSESNVSAKDRRGHNHKTRGTWRSRRESGVNGEIVWTTPTGRVYATTPWDYRDGVPMTPEQMWANHARHVREYTAERQAQEETRESGPLPDGWRLRDGQPPVEGDGIDGDGRVDAACGIAAVECEVSKGVPAAAGSAVTRVCGQSIRRVAARTGLSPHDVLADLVAMIENEEAVAMYDTRGAVVTARFGGDVVQTPIASNTLTPITVVSAATAGPSSTAGSSSTSTVAETTGATAQRQPARGEHDDERSSPIRVRRSRGRRAMTTPETPWTRRDPGPPPF